MPPAEKQILIPTFLTSKKIDHRIQKYVQFTKILKPANYKISDAHLLGHTPQCTKYKMQNVQNTKYKTTKYQLVKGELPLKPIVR